MAADLRLVLVGQERVGKSSAGNTILGRKEFNSELSLVPLTKSSKKAEGEVLSRRVSVVDTPGLSSSVLSPEEVKAEIQRAVELSSPGPHVFLLTMQLGRFTEQEKRGMKILQEILGPEVFKFTIIMFTYGDQLEKTDIDIDKFVQEDENVQKIVKSCSGMYHVFNNQKMKDRKQVQDLLDKIDSLSDGGRRYYPGESGADVSPMLFAVKSSGKTASAGVTSQESDSKAEKDPELRIVLLGKTGVGKSSAGNTILQTEAFESRPSLSSVTLLCQKETNTVNGTNWALIDTPDFFETDACNEEVKKQITKCIRMAAPGPHVFLIVLQPTRFTNEDKKNIKTFQEMFGKEAANYTMVLFTHGDELKKKNIKIEDLLQTSPPLKHIISQCSVLEKFEEKYHVFDNEDKDPDQVRRLMDKINRMVDGNGGNYYTYNMFEEAERTKQEEMKLIRENSDINTRDSMRATTDGKCVLH